MSKPERIKNILKEWLSQGRGVVMVADPLSSLPSLSFCCPVETRRNFRLVRSFGRLVGHSAHSVSVTRSLRPRARPQRQAKQMRHFGKKKQRSRGHIVTLSFRCRCCCRSFQLVYRSQPHAVALRSAVVSSQSNPTVLPILNFPTSIPSLPSLPPSPAPITPPTVDPDSAQSRCRLLGSVGTSFVELSRMIGAADSQARSSPRPESQRGAAQPQVLHRPRSVGGIAAPADSREPPSPQADSTEA